MASIKLQLSTEGNDIEDMAIRAYQHGWCPYTHVDVVLPDGLLGARMDGGVEIRAPGYAPFTRTELVDITCTDEQAAACEAFLRDQIGKPYDRTAIIMMTLPMVRIASFPETAPVWAEPDSWFCSELVAAALWQAGIIGRPPAPVTILTPADVYLIAASRALP